MLRWQPNRQWKHRPPILRNELPTRQALTKRVRAAQAAGQRPTPYRPTPCRPGGSIALHQRRYRARDNSRVPTQSAVRVNGAVSIAVLRAGTSRRKSGASCVRISTSMAAMSIVSDQTPSRVLEIYRRLLRLYFCRGDDLAQPAALRGNKALKLRR